MRSIASSKLIEGKPPFNEIASALLILLYTYAAVSKLLNYSHFRNQMLNQAFPPVVAEILIWVLPVAELTIAGFLAVKSLRSIGFYLSLALMTLFTVYILLVLLHVFSKVPCSCGGVLEHMGWGAHFVFNLFFLALNFIAVISLKTERRLPGAEIRK